MAGKPRVVEVKDRPKKPRVVEEVDYSRMIGTPAPGEGAAKEPVVFKDLKGESLESTDAVRDRLREKALQDITPLSNDEVIRQAEEDRRRRGGIRKRIKNLFGLE
ncbi:MAG: hypothetical protein V1787_01120 [Candidatus Micrarchaeota archaeon]